MGTDCIWHELPGSKVEEGAAQLVSLDSRTGKCTNIAGVSPTVGNFESVHGNFVMLDHRSTSPSALGFAQINMSAAFLISLKIPTVTQKGGVDLVMSTGHNSPPPAW
jgi:hypothetical protein